MENKIKVSIIVPVYNVECYLRQALDSIVGQTLKDIEIICIDDCSTDNSLAILKEYEIKDSRIKVFHLEENQGQGYARNFGLEKVNGEFIGFVDPDDWIEPNMYETLYNLAKKHNAELVESFYTKHIEYRNKTEIEKFIGKIKLPKDRTFNWKIDKKYLFSGSLGVCVKLHKTDFIKRNNIQFENGKAAEDQIFTIKARLLASNICFCDQYFYNYRIRLNSSCDTGLKNKTAIDRIKYLTKIKDFLIEQDVYKEFYDAYWNRAINFCVESYKRSSYKYRKEFKQEMRKFATKKYYKKFKNKIRNYKEFKERIYSIKNMLLPSGKYQILTILGIKIPIKRYIR